jgi:HSP20 family protein
MVKERCVMPNLWKSPDATFVALSREMDRLANDLARPSARGWTGYGLTPAADILESEGGFKVVLDLPGHDPKAIQIEVEKETLTVQAERKFAEPEKGETVRHSERAHGNFRRSFTLPTTVDATKVEARYESGVLTVLLPKREEAKPRTIRVDVR